MRHQNLRALLFFIALAVTLSRGVAQTTNSSFITEQTPPAQPGVAQHAPATLSLKDALSLAEKNDPGMLAAASDAASALGALSMITWSADCAAACLSKPGNRTA